MSVEETSVDLDMDGSLGVEGDIEQTRELMWRHSGE